MDLGGVFKASSYWSNAWKNPKLDSRYGIHSARGQSGVEQWWQVDLPSDDYYEATAMTLMKRGDNAVRDRLITAVQFQFSQDNGKTWHDHKGGKWFKTGQQRNDNNKVERQIVIDPPMHGNAFRVILDASHKIGPNYQGRFDLWVTKDEDFKADENLEAEPQRALMDMGASSTQSSMWSAAWAKPKLDSRTGFHGKGGKENQPFWI